MLKALIALMVIGIVIFVARLFINSPDTAAIKQEGIDFLERNKSVDGVQVTASGLQYKVLEKGNGTETPKASDTVTVHYEGTLINGDVFDSSLQRGQPISFPLNRVIKGWTEGLQLMSPGDKFRLYIPSELAYGKRSAGKIPPNSTLVFDVELISIN